MDDMLEDLNKMSMTTIPQIQFVTMAIGATAQRMGITTTVLYNRLKHHGLVRRLLFDCYDTLHTESIDGVVWNVKEALRNWETKEGGQMVVDRCLRFVATETVEKGGRQ